MNKKYILGIITLILIIGLVYFNRPIKTQDDNTLTVGVSLPLSGPLTEFGEYFKRGLDIGVGNEKNIKIIYEDNQGNSARSVGVFKKFENIDHVDMVIATIAMTAVPLVPLAKESKIPMLISLTQVDYATNKDNDYVYRIYYTSTQLGKLFVDRLVSNNIKTVSILQAKNEGPRAVVEVITKLLEKTGIGVTVETFNDSDTDFRSQILKIKKENPDIIGIATLPAAQWKGLVTQMKDMGVNLPIYDIIGVFLNPGTPEKLAGLSNGIYTLSTPFNLGEYKKDIRDSYVRKYNREPAGFESFAIDTATILKQLLQNKATNKESVAAYLKSIKSFDGITSPYTVDESHNILPVIEKVQFVNGKVIKSEK